MLQAAFSPFLVMYSTHPKKKFYFQVTFILSSAIGFNLDQSKSLQFCKWLQRWDHIKSNKTNNKKQ